MRRDPGPAGCDFYPRSPCGERHRGLPQYGRTGYFYPRSPCGERRIGRIPTKYQLTIISIHALLAESDDNGRSMGTATALFLSTLSLRRATGRPGARPAKPCISIHALLAESDRRSWTPATAKTRFLSTLSLRRATAHLSCRCRQVEFLSTLSLRRATWICTATFPVKVYFYPRSPCGERLRGGFHRGAVLPFLSTLSLRRATRANFAPAGLC